MAEVQCPSPFVAIASLESNIQVEQLAADSPDIFVWNPSDKSSKLDLSEGNLRADKNTDLDGAVRATRGVSSGKWYWEIKIVAGEGPYSQYNCVGIGTSSATLNDFIGKDIYGYGTRGNGRTWHDSNEGYGDTFNFNDIIGVALDLDTGKIFFSKNNVWYSGGDPAAGTNYAFNNIIPDTYFPMYGAYDSDSAGKASFLLSDLTYSPPTGYNVLQAPQASPPNFVANGEISISEIYPGYIDLDEIFVASTNFTAKTQIEISAIALSAATNGKADTRIELDCNGILTGNTVFLCDHCFNYAQIKATSPTPTCDISAVFRYACIEASPPIPTASFKIGRIIEGYCPVSGFTCTACSGRDPSIIASAPCPACSMRIGLSFSGDVPIPICSMVADTHHLATIYGRVPFPLLTCIGDTENIAVISGTVPTPTGLFEVTVGNVASIFGRSPCPYCTMVALTGQVVTLSGRVPIPGDLVRFYASLANDTIILTGTVPTPTMTSSIDCFISSILRHVRGKIR